MPKIKWIGIVNDDIAHYQKNELGSGAKKLEIPSAMTEMMLRALPFAIPSFLIIFLSMFMKTYFSHQAVVAFLLVLSGFIAGFAGLVLHEYLHAVVYPRQATVYIGFYGKAFAAVALVSYPLKRGTFIFMSLLPSVLGVIPIIIFLVSPVTWTAWNGFWYGFAIMGLISPYPDYYNVYQVLRQTPKGCYIQFYEDHIYWFQ